MRNLLIIAIITTVTNAPFDNGIIRCESGHVKMTGNKIVDANGVHNVPDCDIEIKPTNKEQNA